MSWDVSFFASPTPPPPVEEMPGDWVGASLGSPEEVRTKISEVLPSVDWSDENWGIYDGDGFSFEISVRAENPCVSFGVFVRGGGEPVSTLVEIAERNRWYVLDTSQGEWLHHCSDQSLGWSGFQAYRDRVLGR